MSITRIEFDRLTALERGGGLSDDGKKTLEPYRVKRAIFMAAGFGKRLVPVTLKTPKPLVKINGKRIIDTLLDAVVAAGIKEIIIVRGYLKEQFDVLLEKYPDIKFADNDQYNEANNISSVMCVRHLLKNAYILESDLWLSNPALVTKYQYASNYLGVPAEKTDDWCFETDNGIITKVKIGGENCRHMFGISYWDENDGERLSGHVKEAYESPGGKDLYWEEVSLKRFKNEYKIRVRDCSFDDITEIDTLEELIRLDGSYGV